MPRPRFRTNRVHGPGKPLLATLGVLAIVAVVFALYLGPTAVNGIPGIDYYNVKVQFANADTLTLHDHVRIAGVDVGQVSSTTVEHGMAVVNLQLDPGTKLTTDARVQIRPQSAVGTRFVELDPSSSGTPIPSGGMIPASHTKVEVPLSSVLDIFQPQVRAKAQTLLQELGTGFAGRGEDVNTALATLPPTLSHLSHVAAAIDDAGGLGPFVAAGQGAANAADPVRENIAQGFRPEALTLQALAENPGAVRDTLRQAPPTLLAADTGLHETSPLLENVDSFARAAQPALTQADSALVQTNLLLQEGKPGLKAAPAVLALIKPATPATLGLLHTLTPVLPDVDTALSAAQPTVSDLAGRGCDLRYWTNNWASVVSWGDDYSNYLRFVLVAPDETSLAGEGGSEPNIFRDAYPAPCAAETQKSAS